MPKFFELRQIELINLFSSHLKTQFSWGSTTHHSQSQWKRDHKSHSGGLLPLFLPFWREWKTFSFFMWHTDEKRISMSKKPKAMNWNFLSREIKLRPDFWPLFKLSQGTLSWTLLFKKSLCWLKGFLTFFEGSFPSVSR